LDQYHSQCLFMLVAGITALCLVAAGSSAGILLAGAVGGILSRLQVARQPQSFEHVATDYASSWVPLFLSPVLGALAAWAGTLLLSGLQIQVGASMVSPTTATAVASECGAKGAHCLLGVTTATLAAAFVLGFSERYLTGLVGKIDTARDPSKKS
jgi:hypothetical protein